MGAGASTGDAVVASVEDVGKWSKEQVGEQVAAIGKAYEPYQQVAIDNGIDGQTLLGLDDEDLEECVTSKMHRKNIRKKLDALQQGAPSAAPESAVGNTTPLNPIM